MSKIEIDFNNLKYNLYEILNVPQDSDDSKIKKNFIKVIKNFHPDKNSELEDEIYYHIIMANQVLLNKDSRQKYDDFLFTKASTFNELKDSFNKKDLDKCFPEKDKSKELFNNRFEELNKKHGYISTDTSVSVIDRFSKVKQNRSQEVTIEKEQIRSTDEFNQKFNLYKSDGGKFKDQIVEYKGAPTELSTYVVGEQYTSLADINELYIEDSVLCSKYSSLDKAFMLQPVINNLPNKSFDDRMKDYKNQTDHFSKMKITDFSTKKFSEWQ